MARREHGHVDAARLHEGLGLRGEPGRSIEAGAPVERVDADRVARRVPARHGRAPHARTGRARERVGATRAQRVRMPMLGRWCAVVACAQGARLLIEDDEGEVAVEVRGDVVADLLVEVHDGLAVAVGAEARLVAHARAQLLVVVDLAVHRQRERIVLREERLVARERVHDGEALVRDGGGGAVPVVDDVDARAVGAAVADEALQGQRLELEHLERLLAARHGEDAAHLGSDGRARTARGGAARRRGRRRQRVRGAQADRAEDERARERADEHCGRRCDARTGHDSQPTCRHHTGTSLCNTTRLRARYRRRQNVTEDIRRRIRRRRPSFHSPPSHAVDHTTSSCPALRTRRTSSMHVQDVCTGSMNEQVMYIMSVHVHVLRLRLQVWGEPYRTLCS